MTAGIEEEIWAAIALIDTRARDAERVGTVTQWRATRTESNCIASSRGDAPAGATHPKRAISARVLEVRQQGPIDRFPVLRRGLFSGPTADRRRAVRAAQLLLELPRLSGLFLLTFRLTVVALDQGLSGWRD